MRKLLLPLLLIVFFLSGCEKDDICDANTSTTPRLIIEFYNYSDPLMVKNVTNLALISDIPEIEPLRFNSVSKIQVPLKTTADMTQYSFVLNFGNTNPALVFSDVMQFNYSRNEQFVSRACGFKTLFNLNDSDDSSVPDAIILNGMPNNYSGTWIKNIIIDDYSLENETEIHVKIYF